MELYVWDCYRSLWWDFSWLEVPVGSPGSKEQQEQSDRYLAKGQLSSVILIPSQLPSTGSWILGRTPQRTAIIVWPPSRGEDAQCRDHG